LLRVVVSTAETEPESGLTTKTVAPSGEIAAAPLEAGCGTARASRQLPMLRVRQKAAHTSERKTPSARPSLLAFLRDSPALLFGNAYW
jgi:hypothetical protein